MKKALLVIDLQNGVCKDGKIYNYRNVIENINDQIDQFHLNNDPVIFIQHKDEDLIHGSFEWNLISDLHNNHYHYYANQKLNSIQMIHVLNLHLYVE